MIGRGALLASILACAVLTPRGTAVARDATGPADSAAPSAQAPDIPQTLPPPPTQTTEPEAPSAGSQLLGDITAYYTAPLSWTARDWGFFAGTLAAIGVAHHFDSDVRTHFAAALPTAARNSYDLEDAAPAAALVLGTWGFSLVASDQAAWHVTWNMVEALGLSTATDYAIAYATGRERPYQTSDPNRWRAGGTSFPSEHVTAAFAIGTVFAESGDEEHIWLTRFAGYGIATFTAYQRLKHEQHWLSDTVAGAALGGSTALFVLDRAEQRRDGPHISLEPIPGGVRLAYRTDLN
jgi:membrane-associated phospholipid phosphatase